MPSPLHEAPPASDARPRHSQLSALPLWPTTPASSRRTLIVQNAYHNLGVGNMARVDAGALLLARLTRRRVYFEACEHEGFAWSAVWRSSRLSAGQRRLPNCSSSFFDYHAHVLVDGTMSVVAAAGSLEHGSPLPIRTTCLELLDVLTNSSRNVTLAHKAHIQCVPTLLRHVLKAGYAAAQDRAVCSLMHPGPQVAKALEDLLQRWDRQYALHVRTLQIDDPVQCSLRLDSTSTWADADAEVAAWAGRCSANPGLKARLRQPPEPLSRVFDSLRLLAPHGFFVASDSKSLKAFLTAREPLAIMLPRSVQDRRAEGGQMGSMGSLVELFALASAAHLQVPMLSSTFSKLARKPLATCGNATREHGT